MMPKNFPLLLLVAGVAYLYAEEDESFGAPLDLSQMTAHENQPTIADADFKVKRLLEEHARAVSKCKNLGIGARPDAEGKCVCSYGFAEVKGKCLEHKKALPGRAVRALSRIGLDNIEEVPGCESKAACTKMVWDLWDTVDERQAECIITSQHLRDKIYAMNQTYAEDLNERKHQLSEIEKWISKMRDQNQLMVQQLRRYTQVLADGDRLGRESDKMNSEQAMLSSKVAELSLELDRLREQKRALEEQLEPQVTQCEEKLIALKDGLASRGLKVPG